MKSSQLLAGCILVLGCAGAAQAKDMGTNLHCHGVVADSNVGGVLAAIGAMLSGDAGTGPARPAGNGACRTDDGDANACSTLPEAGSGGALPTGSSSGSDDATTPAARKRSTPSLGWQSLLPGSIQ